MIHSVWTRRGLGIALVGLLTIGLLARFGGFAQARLSSVSVVGGNPFRVAAPTSGPSMTGGIPTPSVLRVTRPMSRIPTPTNTAPRTDTLMRTSTRALTVTPTYPITRTVFPSATLPNTATATSTRAMSPLNTPTATGTRAMSPLNAPTATGTRTLTPPNQVTISRP